MKIFENRIYKMLAISVLVALTVVSSVLCLGGCMSDVSAEDSKVDNTSEKISSVAEIEKEYAENLESDSDEIAAKGKNIVIYKSELDLLTDKAVAIGGTSEEEAREYELNYLIKRETLYYNAQKNGYNVTDNQVKEYIDEQKELLNNVEGADDFLHYINSLGMTVDEYWDSQFESTKKDLLISDYLNAEKKKIADANDLPFYPTYVSEGTIDSGSETVVSQSDYEKLESLWQEAYQEMLDKLIAEQNVTIY